MIRSFALCASAVFLVACATAADEPGPTAAEWIEQYAKLGGTASIYPSAPNTVIIFKRQDQKPLVGLKGLRPIPSVRTLLVHGFEIDDEDIEAVAGWKDLERIDLIDCKKVTDKGVKALVSLPKLRELVLADTAVTAAGVDAFSGHKRLKLLTITNTIVDNRVLSLDLHDMPELQSLILICEGLKSVRFSKLPELRELVDFLPELEKAEISELGALEELVFRDTKLKTLTVSGVPKLKSIDLVNTPLNAETVRAIQKALPGVELKK